MHKTHLNLKITNIYLSRTLLSKKCPYYIFVNSQQFVIYRLGSWKRILNGLELYNNWKLCTSIHRTLKGQCHFFWSKNFTWASFEKANTVLWNFSFSRRYSWEMCIRDVSLLKDYDDTLSLQKRKSSRNRFRLGPRSNL